MNTMNNSYQGFTLQDMFFLIGFQARTGELVVEAGNNIGSILVHEGTILNAYSPYSRAIGDLMVEDEVITEDDLFEALDRQKKNMNIPIGTLLLQTGKVTTSLIERMVHDQIRTAVKEFSGWENVQYSFIPRDVTPFDRIRLAIEEFIPQETIQAVRQFLERRQGSGALPGTPFPLPSGFFMKK